MHESRLYLTLANVNRYTASYIAIAIAMSMHVFLGQKRPLARNAIPSLYIYFNQTILITCMILLLLQY